MKTQKTVVDLKHEIATKTGNIWVLQKFTNAFDAALSVPGKHVDCPFPGGHRKGGGKKDFRVMADFDQRGTAICSCKPQGMDLFNMLIEAGCATNIGDALKRVDGLVNGDAAPKKRAYVKPAVTIADMYAEKNKPTQVEWRLNLMQKIQSECLTLDYAVAEPARLYFAKRGIPLDMHKQILFHPNLEYKLHGKSYGFHPAIVTYVRDSTAKAVTFQRIYITAEGDKANVPQPKLLLPEVVAGTINGASAIIRDDVNNRTLHVGEGIELMHAVSLCVEGSVQSGLSANIMEKMKINRERYDTVIIWSDKDPIDELRNKGGAGQKASLRLATRLMQEGFTVAILEPRYAVRPDDAKAIDWEDVIVKKNVMSLPFSSRWQALLSKANPDKLTIELPVAA